MAVETGSVLAGFTYAEPVTALVRRFKFHDDLAAGRILARLAAEAFVDSTPKALIPIPLHATRLRQRGFNQALELARYWGRRQGIPVLPQALIRTRATETQSSLPAEARRTNVAGAFQASGILPAHVALVDDVVTTGSTTAEAAKALLQAGASRVDVWCLARVV
jgi:ComF family protein